MTEEVVPPPITHEHVISFGYIVITFAKVEVMIQQIISRILQVPMTTVLILTNGLGYAGKRDSLLSILANTEGDEADITKVNKIKEYLGELHKYNSIRNAIAHQAWRDGTRPGSIKPMQMVVRGGSGKLKGYDAQEQDYTAQDMMKIANDLHLLFGEFFDYLTSVGLATRALDITRYTEPTS